MNEIQESASVYRSEPQDPNAEKRPRWLIPTMFGLGLLGFVLILGRSEISRWYFASAKNAIVEGRYDEAIEAANKGLHWEPNYVKLIALRAYAHQELDDFEACLSDYDQMIELAAQDEVTNEDDISPKAAKASVLQRMDRYREALVLWDEIVEYRAAQYDLRNDTESKNTYALAMNNRAYFQAQAYVKGDKDVDLEKSLVEIRDALEIRGADDEIMIDTLGYLLLLNGQKEEALAQFEIAVALAQSKHQAQKSRWRVQMSQMVDQRPVQDLIEQLDQHFSIILHHRGEAYEAVGEKEKADADYQRALQLGFNPAEGVW